VKSRTQILEDFEEMLERAERLSDQNPESYMLALEEAYEFAQTNAINLSDLGELR
jgi:hypothetical protein